MAEIIFQRTVSPVVAEEARARKQREGTLNVQVKETRQGGQTVYEVVQESSSLSRPEPPSGTSLNVIEYPGNYSDITLSKAPGSRVEVKKMGGGSYQMTTTNIMTPGDPTGSPGVSQPVAANYAGVGQSQLMSMVSKEFQTIQPNQQTSQPEYSNLVSMSPQMAYQSGVISQNEMKHAEAGGWGYEIPQNTLSAAQSAKGDMMFNALSQGKPKFETGAATSPYRIKMNEAFSAQVLAEDKQQRFVTISENQLIKASYVLNADWFGMGTLSEAAVSHLTGTSWKKRRSEMMLSYSSELWDSKQTPTEAGITSFLITGGKAALFALPGGAAGKGVARAASLVGEGLYYSTIGSQAVETLQHPTGENMARLFVYSAPGVAGVAAKGPKIVIRDVKFPMKEGIDKTVWSGLSFEYGTGARAVPLLGVSEGKFMKGTLKMDLNRINFGGNLLEGKGGFKPSTSPTETKIFLNSLETKSWKYGNVDIAYVNSFAKGSVYLEKQVSAWTAKTISRDSKSWTPEQMDFIIKFTKANKGKLESGYGSAFDVGQFGDEKSPKSIQILKESFGQPSDVDLKFQWERTTTIAKRSELVAGLNKIPGGHKARVSPESETLIESSAKNWGHGVDLHDLASGAEDVLILNRVTSSDPAEGFGFTVNQKTKNVEGLPIMSVSESTLRRGISSNIIWEDTIGPKSHRIKDVNRYILGRRLQIESARASRLSFLKSREITKAERQLDIFTRSAKEKGLLTSEPARTEVDFSRGSKYSSRSPRSILLSPRMSSRSDASSASMPSASVSRTMSRMMSGSVSPPRSASRNMSPSISASPSLPRSVSRSMSPSRSVSPLPSRSLSRMLSGSPSPSPSRSASRSVSPSRSFSPSPSRYASRSMSSMLGSGRSSSSSPSSMLSSGSSGMDKEMRKLFGRGTKYAPSISGMVSGKSLSKAPRGTLSGIGARFPVLLGGRRKKRK